MSHSHAWAAGPAVSLTNFFLGLRPPSARTRAFVALARINSDSSAINSSTFKADAFTADASVSSANVNRTSGGSSSVSFVFSPSLPTATGDGSHKAVRGSLRVGSSVVSAAWDRCSSGNNENRNDAKGDGGRLLLSCTLAVAFDDAAPPTGAATEAGVLRGLVGIPLLDRSPDCLVLTVDGIVAWRGSQNKKNNHRNVPPAELVAVAAAAEDMAALAASPFVRPAILGAHPLEPPYSEEEKLWLLVDVAAAAGAAGMSIELSSD